MAFAVALAVMGILSGLYFLRRLYSRLQLSLAKHPSLRGHAKWSRRLAKLVPYYEFDAQRFYCSDGAPAEVARTRREGMEALRRELLPRSTAGAALTNRLRQRVSDVAFTGAYRVPFPYRRHLPQEFKQTRFVEATQGVAQVQDIDGNHSLDLSGSYGLNVFGYEFYKSCINDAVLAAQDLGPVLGPYHPLIAEVADRLAEVSGLDEVSFHMSGTEAVMQAVRLARYHTGKTHLVRFCGAYHGWWDGVQPGVGNQRRTHDVYTLSDMSERSLGIIGSRSDIACVLVNPLQAMHPNGDAPGDATLLSSRRSAGYDRQAYTDWLRRLRDVCSRAGVVLIMDEVFTGFRLAHGGAQAYFGVQADLVTYGKTLGGGLPLGVLCGRADLMKRFRDHQPANISFARGTFNSHPYVLASVHSFLQRIEQPEVQQLYASADALWDERIQGLNALLDRANLPVQLVNMQSVATVLYTRPSRYNWMLQFYLRAVGLELSWVGSGRLIFSLALSDEEFQLIAERFVSAAQRMEDDGWWWQSPQLDDQTIKRQLMQEMLRASIPLAWVRRQGRGNNKLIESGEA